MSAPRPHPSRLDPADVHYEAIVAAHEEAVAAGQLLYRDPVTGLSVLSVLAHLERGECCTRGCRHCPFVED